MKKFFEKYLELLRTTLPAGTKIEVVSQAARASSDPVRPAISPNPLQCEVDHE